MSNWVSWLWCKSLVAWRMKDVSFFSHLWNLSFVIGWQPICRLLCRCLFNTSILNKISRMNNALSSGELLAIATTMMGNMWSMVFLRELKGPSKGCHFSVPTYVCWFFLNLNVLMLRWQPLLFPLLWHVLHALSLGSQFIFYFVSWIWILYCIVVRL